MPGLTGNFNFPHEVRVLSVEQFHKTKMCPHMNKSEGCIRSIRSDCPYAHSVEELKEPPNLIKTAMCKLHLRNSCNKPKEECPYAHDFAELRHTDGFYKTFVCKFWQKGHCKAGELCRYAHGTEELRKNPYISQQDSAEIDALRKSLAIVRGSQNVDSGTQLATNDKECHTPTLSAGYCYNPGAHSSVYVYPFYGEVGAYCPTPRTTESQQWVGSPDQLLCKEQEEAYYLMLYYLQKYIDCCSKQQLLMHQSESATTPCTTENDYKN